MVKIKTKKEMNFPELIEHIADTGYKIANYDSKDNSSVVSVGSLKGITTYGTIYPHKTFEVEIEEEITEDTVIPKLLVKFKSPSRYQVFSNDYINGFEVEEGDIEACYTLNDDLTMTLIWTKEKGLVD